MWSSHPPGFPPPCFGLGPGPPSFGVGSDPFNCVPGQVPRIPRVPSPLFGASPVRRLLHVLGSVVIPFFVALAGVFLAALWRMLGAAVPGRRTPLGCLLWPELGIPLSVTWCMRFASPAQTPCLDWTRQRLRRTNKRRAGVCAVGMQRLLLWHLLVWNLPQCIWCAPRGLPTLSAAAEAAGAAQPRRVYPAPPDPLGESEGLPPDRAPDVIHPSVSPPRGPPPPLPIRTELPALRQQTTPVQTCDVDCAAFVMCPGYQPESLRLRVGMPCDIEDFVDSVGRGLSDLKLPFCNRLLAVRPQPLPGCASLIVVPDWAAYAALSAVCLDLRDLSPNGHGPLTAAFVPRPTCRADLCRQAGLYGTRPCRVFIGTEELPLEDDEAVQLANGCVVTFMQADTYPHFATDLQYRLQFPESWPNPPQQPSAPPIRALLLLHRYGRFLFRGQASELPLDEAAARFIGVERGSVEIHTPGDDGCARIQHQCVGARGVLAFVDRDPEPAAEPQYIVFLDLRQLASGIKFLVLSRPFILKEELPGLVKRKPPPSWRLRVLGGRMRRNRLDVQHNATLVFGFEFDDDSDQPPDPFSPTTSSGDGDTEGSESEADEGTENSEATTRSRSARRRHAEPSSDHSYHGGFDQEPTGDSGGADSEQPAQPLPVLREEPRHGAAGPVLFADVCCPCSRCLCQPGSLAAKLLVEPSASGPPPVDALPHLRDMADALGMPWRYATPAHIAEQLLLAPPQPADEAGDFPAVMPLSFAVLAPGYVQENVVVRTFVPADVDAVLQLVQAEREPDRQRRFPMLLPALPQPSPQWGLVLALPLWDPQASIIIIDARSFDTRLFAVQSPVNVSRRVVLWLAGITQDTPVHVWSSFEPEPLHDDIEYRVFPGQCLSIVGYHLPRPDAFSLRDMLLQTASWSPRPAFPQYAPGPCYCCATERGHLLFTVDQSAPWALRPDLAAACGFDASAMHLSPAQPRVLDCAVYGHVCRTVLAVGRRPPNSEGGCTWAIVIDCRPILQGWHYVATAGVVDFDRLEVELGELAPPFWELFIANRPAGAGHHSVCDGQVFVAEFRARRQVFYPEDDISDEVSASQDPSSGSPRSPARQDVAQRPDGSASRPHQVPETSGGAPLLRPVLPPAHLQTCVALGYFLMPPFARVPGASPLSTGCVCPQAGGICLLFLSSACACGQSPQVATIPLSRIGLQFYLTVLLARLLGELLLVLQLCLAQAVMQLSAHCQRLAGLHSRRTCRSA